jgi:hypothetical protein
MDTAKIEVRSFLGQEAIKQVANGSITQYGDSKFMQFT